MLNNFDLFGIKIHTFYFMIFVSIIIMSIINCFRIKNKYKWFLGIVIALVVNAIAIFGAYLLFHIEEPTAPLTSFGLSFFGTVYFLPIGMHFVSYCFRKYSKKEFRDLWALTVPMELSLVRLGCFFAGCCLGVQAHHGVHFPNDPEGFYRVPIQLIEVVFDVGIFILLIVLEKKKINKGYLYPIFMVSYGFIRFILEFWRDTAKHFYGLSNGQIFAFISVIIGCIWIMLLYRKKENVR